VSDFSSTPHSCRAATTLDAAGRLADSPKASRIKDPTATPEAAATTASTGKNPPTVTSTTAAVQVSHHNPPRQRRDSSGPHTVNMAAVPDSQATGGKVTANMPLRPESRSGHPEGCE
jgi:hypothetical protein